jgi:hypothetical protein
VADDQQARIAQIENEQAALRAKMADRAVHWQGATACWLQADLDQNVQWAVESFPGRVKELAAGSQLTKLKNDVNTLKAAVPRLVAEMFGGVAEVWSHVHGTVFSAITAPRWRRH